MLFTSIDIAYGAVTTSSVDSKNSGLELCVPLCDSVRVLERAYDCVTEADC